MAGNTAVVTTYIFLIPEDAFPGDVEFNSLMASSSNKVMLQKLVKEHMKT